MAECLSQYLCNQLIMDNINDSCDNPMFSGMDEGAYIFNYNDINKGACELNVDNPRTIENIVLNDNTRGFYVINARTNPYTGTNTTIEVGDYRNTFTRTVSLFVPMDGAGASKEILDPLANGRFVVILRNQFVNDRDDNEYQVYGFDRGLKVSSMTQTKYENNDYWVVELQETGVPNSGRFFQHYNPQLFDGRMVCEWITENQYKITVQNVDGDPIASESRVLGEVGQADFTGDIVISTPDTEYIGHVRTPRTIGTDFNADSVSFNDSTSKFLCDLVGASVDGYHAEAEYISDGNYRIVISNNGVIVGETTYDFGNEGDDISGLSMITVVAGSYSYALSIESATTVGQSISFSRVYVSM